jgi:nitrite reductase/ring-hydroxylating ferredoxin subunit/uncharacterized membrane protein
MAVQTIENVRGGISDAIESQKGWLDAVGESLQGALTAALEAGGEPARSAKTFLNGSWLGHPFHAAISDVPVGAWMMGALMDLLGYRRAADALVTTGVVSAIPTALAGAADWHDTVDRDRRVGIVHAALNSTALLLFVGSTIARRRGSRALGVGLSSAGLSVALGAQYLGGELVFNQGVNVNRTAWDPGTEKFQVAARLDEIRDGALKGAEIDADGQKVPIVLLRHGDHVHALHGRCAHAGGPLAEGKVVDETCVECPWHGSTFDMRDGTVVQGPSAYPQPALETRIRDGNVEVKLTR